MPDETKTDAEPNQSITSTTDDSLNQVSQVPPSETAQEDISVPKADVTNKPRGIKRLGTWYVSKKKVSIPIILLVLLGILVAVPYTRYAMVGWFWKQTITVKVIDSQTNSAVSEATVAIGDRTAKTDKSGIAKFASIPVGYASVTVEKKYYESSTLDVMVPLFTKKEYSTQLKATGRLIKVSAKNKISGAAISGVLIKSSDNNQAQTSDDGSAYVVVPAEKQTQDITYNAEGYVSSKGTLEQGKDGVIELSPVGRMYFLSKLSGKIDVVSTNFDGSDRKTVVAGTGKESDYDTTLLASRDWKYLVLSASRDETGKQALYSIDTQKDTIAPLDNGNASFNLIGWSGHQFMYNVTRDDIKQWQPKNGALKTFNAETSKLTVMDETAAVGSNEYDAMYESLGNFYIIDNLLLYTKIWYSNIYGGGSSVQNHTISSIKPDGSLRTILKSYSSKDTQGISGYLYKPQETYYQIYPRTDGVSKANQFVEYEDGKIIDADKSEFSETYLTYLVSPDGSKTFWSETRDGKQALFIGDKNAENKDQLALASEYTAYGWMTDKYLLLQKNNSELYITTKEQLKVGVSPVKISDYHKAGGSFTGYGYGYGGL